LTEEAIIWAKTKIYPAVIAAHNSFSVLQNKISTLRKGYLTNLVVALTAEQRANKMVVVVLIEAMIAPREKCTLLPARLVV
jgi:hypothetical protein